MSVETKHYVRSFFLFVFFILLLLTLRILDQVVLYRPVNLDGITLMAGVFIMPAYYFTCDIIAELYGYRVVRITIYLVLFCGLLFALLVNGIIMMPYPVHWGQAHSYQEVFGHILRSTLAAFVIVPISSLINAKILVRWKALTHGRFFAMRSFGSSAIGEAVQMVLGCLLLYYGTMPFHKLLDLMFFLYVFQVGIDFLLAIPGGMLLRVLRRYEFTLLERRFSSPFVYQDECDETL